MIPIKYGRCTFSISRFECFFSSYDLRDSSMYDHTKLEGVSSADIYENLDCLVFRFGLIFSSAFHLPGGT